MEHTQKEPITAMAFIDQRLEKYADCDTHLKEINSAMDKEIFEIRRKYAEPITTLQQQKDSAFSDLESFAVLNQMLETQNAAKLAMTGFSRQFAEVALLQTAPGVGIITACKFVAYLQTPKRFSNKRQLWRYCRLGVTRRESNGKRLSYPRLDRFGVGSLKDVSRKIF